MLPLRTLTSNAFSRCLWVGLFAALAPTVLHVFHAAASRDAAELHAVCSSALKGATPSAAPSAPVWWRGDSPESVAIDDHCPLCLLSVDRLAPPPISMLGIAIQPETYAVPVAPPPQFVKSFLELNPPTAWTARTLLAIESIAFDSSKSGLEVGFSHVLESFMQTHASRSPVFFGRSRHLLLRLALASLIGLAVLSIAPYVQAHGTRAGDLLLDHAYAVPSVPGTAVGKAFLRGIKNSGGQADHLLSASTPIAAAVELQSLRKQGNDLHAETVTAIELAPNAITLLRHTGDYQLLLRDLKQPLKDGDRFDLTLNFARAGTQTVKVWVQIPHDAHAGH